MRLLNLKLLFYNLGKLSHIFFFFLKQNYHIFHLKS